MMIRKIIFLNLVILTIPFSFNEEVTEVFEDMIDRSVWVIDQDKNYRRVR